MAIKEEIKRSEVTAYLDLDTTEVYNFIIDDKVIITFPERYLTDYKRELRALIATDTQEELTLDGIYGDCLIRKIDGAQYRVIKGKDTYIVSRSELTKLYKINY